MTDTNAFEDRMLDIESIVRDDLTDNQRSLLLDDMLYRVKETLSQIERGIESGIDPASLRAYLSLATNAVALCGFANTATRQGHGKWGEGKKVAGPVEEVLIKWMRLLRDATTSGLDTLGLPEEQVARIKAGGATAEDVAAVKAAAEAKWGDRAQVAVVGEPLSADAEPASTDPGYGMYL
jgi:hypothetical protein